MKSSFLQVPVLEHLLMIKSPSRIEVVVETSESLWWKEPFSLWGWPQGSREGLVSGAGLPL